MCIRDSSVDRVYINSTQDTDVTPFDTGAYASRQTYVSGMACKKCALEFRQKVLEYAAYMLNHDVTDLSKTVYADLVKEAAGKVRQVLGLHAEEKITWEMLDIADSQVVVNGGDPVLFDVAVVADTCLLYTSPGAHGGGSHRAGCPMGWLHMFIAVWLCRNLFFHSSGLGSGTDASSCIL